MSAPWLPLCLAIALALSTGACSREQDMPTAPSPTGSATSYTVIGASDALGYGGSAVCAPFDLNCPNGSGYAQQLLRRLQNERGSVEYRNLGVPGSVMSPAMEALAGQIGRTVARNFVEGQAPFVPPTTTVVTVFAGANDANVIGEAVRAGLGGTDPRAYIDQQIRQWGDDLGSLVARIRDRAPSARIVALNLPNLGAAPYLSDRSVQERSVMQRIAVGLADRANALTGRRVLVVDLLCEARLYDPANFASDGFHPSDRGHTLMADLAYPAVANGSAPPPAASCPQRTLLPAF